MASLDMQLLSSGMDFVSFASTEIVLFIMAAVVYGLFVHGPLVPFKNTKLAKAKATSHVSGGRSKGKHAVGAAHRCAATSPPWRRQAEGADAGKNLQPAAEIRALAREGDLDGAAALLSRIHVGGASPNAIHNCFLDACVQNGDIKRALAHFAEMKQLEVVDVVSYNTMLKAHLRRGQVSEAKTLLCDMAACGLKASQFTYNELLNALVNAGDQRGIWRLLDEMRKADAPVTSITLSILLKSLTERSSSADVQRMMGLVDALEEPVDEVLFQSVIEASIKVKQLCFLSNLIQRHRAQKDGIMLSASLYSSMIKAFGHAGDTAQVHELWCDMEARGVKPTEVTVGCMVDALVVNGQSAHAYDLVQKLQEDAQTKCVNTVIYSTLLKGFAYSKNMDKVFAVYSEMQTHGVQCNTITYNTLLDACAKNGRMDRAPALLKDMRGMNSEPDLITYSSLIKGYCLEGSIDKAFKVLEELKSKGTLRPDEITYNSILDGCAKKQRVDEALSVLDEMQGAGIKPSNYTLSILVKLLGRTKRLSQAFQIVEDLSSRHGLHPNVQVYTCLIQACFNTRKLERALHVHDDMIAKGCAPDEKLYVALVSGCLRLKAPHKASDVVRAAFQLPGGTLAVPTSTRGRTTGIDTRTLEEVCEALRASGPDNKAAAAALALDLQKIRGVRLGDHASPSKAVAAPWRR